MNHLPPSTSTSTSTSTSPPKTLTHHDEACYVEQPINTTTTTSSSSSSSSSSSATPPPPACHHSPSQIENHPPINNNTHNILNPSSTATSSSTSSSSSSPSTTTTTTTATTTTTTTTSSSSSSFSPTTYHPSSIAILHPSIKIDFLVRLPIELSLYILLKLGHQPHSLLVCRLVSKSWRGLAEDPLIWKEIFLARKDWKVKDLYHQPLTPSTPSLNHPHPLTSPRHPPLSNHPHPYPLNQISEETIDPLDRNDLHQPQSSSSLFNPPPPLLLPHSPLPILSRQNSMESYRSIGSGNTQIARRLSQLLGDSNSLLPICSSSSSSTTTTLNPQSIQPPSSDPILNHHHQSRTSSTLPIQASNLEAGFNASQSDPAHCPQEQHPCPTQLDVEPVHSAISLDWLKLYRDRWILDSRWKEGKQITRTLKGHKDSIYCLQMHGDRIITGSRDRTLKVWDWKTRQCIKTLMGHKGSVLCLRFDSTIMLTGSSDCEVIVWDPEANWSITNRLIGHQSGVLDLDFNAELIVSCSKDTTVKVWDRLTGRLIRSITGHTGPVNALELTRNYLDLTPQDPAGSGGGGGPTKTIGSKTRGLLTASGDSTMKLWELESGRLIRTFEGHIRGLACLKLIESQDLVITGSNDETIKVWNLKTSQCLMTLLGHSDLVRTLDVDVDHHRVVSGSYDKTIKVWDLRTGELKLDFRKGERSLVFDVQFNLTEIVLVGHDSKVTVLDFSYGLDCQNFL